MREKHAGKMTLAEIGENNLNRIIRGAALSVSGVAGMHSRLRETLMNSIRPSANDDSELPERGVKITESAAGVAVDVYLDVWYGEKIPDLSWDVQRTVRSTVQDLCGLTLREINVHVQSVLLQGAEAGK